MVGLQRFGVFRHVDQIDGRACRVDRGRSGMGAGSRISPLPLPPIVTLGCRVRQKGRSRVPVSGAPAHEDWTYQQLPTTVSARNQVCFCGLFCGLGNDLPSQSIVLYLFFDLWWRWRHLPRTRLRQLPVQQGKHRESLRFRPDPRRQKRESVKNTTAYVEVPYVEEQEIETRISKLSHPSANT